MTKPICLIPGCGLRGTRRSLCSGHYNQWWEGRPLTPIIRGLENRFWAKVDKSGDCWIWLGAKNENGYGHFKWHDHMVKVHRIAYQLLIGPILDGLELDHLCRTRACVNPEHLEPVDHRTNTLRGDGFTAAFVLQTHCLNGHEFTEDNTYRSPKHPTSRDCKTCRLERSRQYYQRKRANALFRSLER